MNLKKTLEDYLSAQKKHKTTKHELGEAEIRLEMECRKAKNTSSSEESIFYQTDENLRMLATILLDKLKSNYI